MSIMWLMFHCVVINPKILVVKTTKIFQALALLQAIKMVN